MSWADAEKKADTAVQMAEIRQQATCLLELKHSTMCSLCFVAATFGYNAAVGLKPQAPPQPWFGTGPDGSWQAQQHVLRHRHQQEPSQKPRGNVLDVQGIRARRRWAVGDSCSNSPEDSTGSANQATILPTLFLGFLIISIWYTGPQNPILVIKSITRTVTIL